MYHNHVIVKDSGSTRETPWHQDQAYYEIDGEQVNIGYVNAGLPFLHTICFNDEACSNEINMLAQHCWIQHVGLVCMLLDNIDLSFKLS